MQGNADYAFEARGKEKNSHPSGAAPNGRFWGSVFGEWFELGLAGSKPRDLGSDRGYRAVPRAADDWWANTVSEIVLDANSSTSEGTFEWIVRGHLVMEA